MLEENDLQMISAIVAKEIEPLKREVNTIQSTLDHETYKGFEILAEGHSDIKCKLNEILKLKAEKMMADLKIVHLESELEIIKSKMGKVI